MVTCVALVEFAPSAPPALEISTQASTRESSYSYSANDPSFSFNDQNGNVPPQSNNNQLPPLNPEIGPTYRHPRITEKVIKEYYFTEGDGLKYYMDTFKSCCEIVIGNHSLPPGVFEYRQLICIYLGLKTLDCDNHEAFNYHSASDSWERQGYYSYLTHTITQLHQYLLNEWTQDAPAILTRIDTWVKRKKGLQGMIFQRGDKESILKWNIAFINVLITDYLVTPGEVRMTSSGVIAQLRCLLVTTLEKVIKEYDRLPYSLLPDFVWEILGIARLPISDTEKSSLRNVLCVYILFQQIRHENDSSQLTKGDSQLENKFLEISTEFSNTLKITPGYITVQQTLRTHEKKIFSTLQTYQILSFNPNRISKIEVDKEQKKNFF